MKRYHQFLVVGSILLTILGCQDVTGLQTLTGLSGEFVLPTAVQNSKGAYGMAASARHTWQNAFAQYIIASGLLTDELQANARGGLEDIFTLQKHTSGGEILLDARILDRSIAVNSTILDSRLHEVRGAVSQAVGALAKYAGDSSATLRGALYAYAAYAEIMLADLFCSGIPLSTWDFEKDFTYKPGSTTTEVYKHAIALFDTAIILAYDSLPIRYLASVGKGRALLAIGEFAQAAAAVADVPTDFQYQEPLYTCGTSLVQCTGPTSAAHLNFNMVSVSNYEGGQSIIGWTNPRTLAQQIGTTPYNFPVYFPKKYTRNGISQVTVASGVEAMLIRAEAALQDDDIPTWLDILNTLRAGSPLTDTMAAIVDPGPPERVDTLFSERAQWLFLTGHRQGDLRRLIRQYSRDAHTVYPSGEYPGGVRLYGNDVTMPINDNERYNPLFHGCIDRRA
jgi:hypothetical protein